MKDLASAIIEAEALVDLRSSTRNDGEKAKSKTKENRQVEKKAGKGFQRRPYTGPAKYDKTKSEGKATSGSSNTKSAGCFICDRPHQARDYRKCDKLVALIMEMGSDSEGPTRVNPLQLLGAFRTIKGKSSPSLLYVDLTLNNRAMQGMVDTVVTHNFINEGTSTRLGLKAGEHSSRVKAINFQARPVLGE